MKLVFNGNSQLSLIDNEVLAHVMIAALWTSLGIDLTCDVYLLDIENPYGRTKKNQDIRGPNTDESWY